MPAENITLSLPWGTLAAKAWGPVSGRRVLALHGWLDNAASFDGLAPRLAEHVRLVALDLPGHGHSDPLPKGMIYHFVDAALNVALALDALGWDRCRLLGHSMGGAIASLLAGIEPGRFERVALLEALGPFTADPKDAPARAESFLCDWRALGGKQKPVYRDLDAAVAARLAVGGIGESSARSLAERGTVAVEGGVSWRSDIRLRLPTPLRLTEDHVEAFLGRIGCPVWLMWASDGLEIPTQVLERRQAAVKSLQLVEVPGGHHVHLDSPDTVAGPLVEFLTR